MENLNDEKIFFSPGDICTLKQDIPNKPTMIVTRIERNLLRHNGNQILKGVKTRWFTKDGSLQEAVFSTKDLLKL